MKTVRKVTRQDITVSLDRETLIRHLNAVIPARGSERIRIPPDAKVYVMVPGGGDWSNTDLDVSDDVPLQIRWTETETTDAS